MEPIEIDYEVAPGIYQRAFRAYLWRAFGGFATGAALALVLAAAVGGSEPWLSGFLAGLALAYLLNLWRFYRRMAALAEARGNTRVTLRVGEPGLSFRSERGDWMIPWQLIHGVVQRGEVVELDLGRSEPPVWILAQAVAGRPLEAIEAALPRPRLPTSPGSSGAPV